MAITKQTVERLEKYIYKLYPNEDNKIFIVSPEELKELKSNNLTKDFIKTKRIMLMDKILIDKNLLNGYKDLVLLAKGIKC